MIKNNLRKIDNSKPIIKCYNCGAWYNFNPLLNNLKPFCQNCGNPKIHFTGV